MNKITNHLPTAELQALDAAHHMHPFTSDGQLAKRGVRVITGADGIWLKDSEGNRILDGMAGLWCVNVGYGRHELAEAAARQINELSYYNTFFMTTHVPAIALAVVQAAVLARWTRSSVLETLREDYVRTARAKGLSRRAVLWQHVLRNAMIPVLTILGLQFAFLISGTVVVEQVFVLPGIGRLVFQAIANRDLVVVRDVVLLLVAMVVIVNFVVDVLYAVIDPRLKPSDA